ncbi:eCIS core domain-containing protein [Nostoc sp.]|uniref:eCIS core domain-containing protein n=1 Tax=Nostoc sp. TaxID=1180 RepID=UPI002FF484D0
MSTQKLLQKKSTSTDTATSDNQFEGRGFAVQSKSDNQQSDLNTQLKQAKRFGHSISQMKSESAQPSKQNQTSQNSSSGSRGSMPAPVRSKMENSFGANFGDVNIHTDSDQAKSMGALAFTQGSNVHFAPGQYNPQSSSGQALLGHELTHVVQQRAGRVAVPDQSKGAPINADPSLETEADQIGAKAANGEQVQVPGATSSFKTIPPIQNSTKPVQCRGGGLLGLAEGALGGIMGGGGGQQQGGGGMMSGLGGMLGGMLGPLGGIAGSMLGGVADSFMGGGGGGQQQE